MYIIFTSFDTCGIWRQEHRSAEHFRFNWYISRIDRESAVGLSSTPSKCLAIFGYSRDWLYIPRTWPDLSNPSSPHPGVDYLAEQSRIDVGIVESDHCSRDVLLYCDDDGWAVEHNTNCKSPSFGMLTVCIMDLLALLRHSSPPSTEYITS